MTDLVWREPVCEPLDRISPSALNTLMECPKRLAFQRDPKTRHWQGRSTRTALGRVAHRLTELVAGGGAPAPPDRKDWLEARWDELVGQEYLDIQQAWISRTVPEPKDWPGYVATRVRLLRRLADLPAATRPLQGHHPGESPNAPPLPWIERQLEDEPNRLFGTPDRVEDQAGRLRVLDLKSGVHQSGISEGQRRQLLIYAHLVQASGLQLPDEVVIQDVRGREEAFEVVADEVESLVAEADAQIGDFNRMVETSRIPARPAPEGCPWCPFRVVCRDYWMSRNEDWPRLDVRGVVIESLGDNSVRLELATEVGGSADFRVLLANGVRLGVGEEVVALDLEPAGPAAGRMRWNSRLRAGSDT